MQLLNLKINNFQCIIDLIWFWLLAVYNKSREIRKYLYVYASYNFRFTIPAHDVIESDREVSPKMCFISIFFCLFTKDLLRENKIKSIYKYVLVWQQER